MCSSEMMEWYQGGAYPVVAAAGEEPTHLQCQEHQPTQTSRQASSMDSTGRMLQSYLSLHGMLGTWLNFCCASASDRLSVACLNDTRYLHSDTHHKSESRSHRSHHAVAVRCTATAHQELLKLQLSTASSRLILSVAAAGKCCNRHVIDGLHITVVQFPFEAWRTV